jgi:predicted aminopeptidase
MRSLRVAALLLAAALPFVLGGCESLNFYRQAVSGQLGLLAARTNVERLLADPRTDPRLAGQLTLTREILEFASIELDLPVAQRYSSYVALDRSAAVWVVYATPEFSVQPVQWCYPFIGCAAYRGYFDLGAATRYARAQPGYDTHVTGATAYSTLGWFNDPLLSTFIHWPDFALAGLLFHELAHVRLYIGGDTALNEGYATFVERQGTRAWLRATDREHLLDAAERRWRDRDRFARFMLAWRDRFADLYAQPYAPGAMRMLKAEMTGALVSCYEAHRDELGGGTFDRFFDEPVNNARFVTMAVYDRLVPAFERLFAQAGGDWSAFHRSAEALAGEPPAQRQDRLVALLADEHVADVRNDDDTDQVQCKALAHHSVDREAPGAEHDDVGRGRDG